MNGLLIGDDKAYANVVTFAGGTGSLELPYLIATPDQLNEVREHLGAGIYFKLIADIDLSEYPADDDAGWLPIGNYSEGEFFSGNFDGNGFKIMNLMINRPTQDYIGLFDTNKGTITNVTLENMNVTGNYSVGGLASMNSGTIDNITVTGSVYGVDEIGGLVGYNPSEISNSTSSASVYGLGSYIGGLVAYNSSEINNSSSSASVHGEGNFIGGLVGYNESEISNSSSSASVHGLGVNIGGLVGYNHNESEISNSSSSASVHGESSNVGGLVGHNLSKISNSSSSASVYGAADDIGGLVGHNSSEISNSSSSASVHGRGANVGGLVGTNMTADTERPATISNSFATGDVMGESGHIGGLVGLSGMKFGLQGQVGSINNSYATGYVSGSSRMGGLVGDNRLPIYNSYATGTVTGNVYGDDHEGHEIGGLAGYNESEISNSYARGTLLGTSMVGGLVGSNVGDGSVSNSYATGSVNGTTGTDIGGLIGQKSGTGLISGSYYNSETLPLQVDNGLGIGKTTAEMQLDSTYIGWSRFPDIWEINASINSGYPYLKSLPSSTIAGVIAPIAGSIPIDSIVETTSYTAAITWSPEDVPFAAGTVYTAEIAISPKTGYTLTGVMANFFKVAGASTTNPTNSGVVTAVFPAAAPSSAATLTSTIGTVSMGGTANETITDIPYGTKLVALKAAITPAANATFNVYNADGTTEASTLTTGKKVVVTAQDGITKVTYTVTVNSAPSDSDEDSPAPPTNETVTSSDGTLTLPAGRTGEVSLESEVTVTIPSDATDKELRITIEKVLSTQSLLANQEVLLSSVYEILKNFSENFNSPVTLTFIFDPASLKSNQKAAVFYYDEVNKIWVEVGGVVSGNKITVEVDHFTKYAVMVVGGADEPVMDTPTVISFSDIFEHWAEASIKQAVIDGIVRGYPDGTFMPDRTVTRAEFTVMLMNALKHQEAGKELIFTDKAMIGAWAQKAVEQAIQAGIINGYLDGTFRPSAAITRAEMAKMIAVSIGQAIELHANETDFADNEDIPVWAKGSIAYLKDEGIMQGMGNNVFAPQDHATRAEAVEVLLNMLAFARK